MSITRSAKASARSASSSRWNRPATRTSSTELGRKIAMHVAAANPLALDAAGLDPAVLEREKNVLREKNAGKPAHVLEKIVESGLKTYYKEVTLLEQPFIHDNAKTVGAGGGRSRQDRRALRSRSRASCAMRSARASRSRKPISRPKSRRRRPARPDLRRRSCERRPLVAAFFICGGRGRGHPPSGRSIPSSARRKPSACKRQ